MRRDFSILLRWVCCVALALALLPASATVVCVREGRIVGLCPMAGRAMVSGTACESMDATRACCPRRAVRAVGAPGSRRSVGGTHCEVLSPGAQAPLALSRALVLDPVAALPPEKARIALTIFAEVDGDRPGVGADSDPPPRRSRAPDRGRAPPVVA